ncbi:MAG: PilT/PilU family type 4a pilus ATPase, partial [Planctomycetes bacterium]|nr:PilT/PilU family type 4a pilus ATPase [Planctomycetota bacterium]
MSANDLKIQDLLLWMGKFKASDLHLKNGRPPIVRVDGDLKPFDLPPVSGSDIERLLLPLMSERTVEQFRDTHEADFSYFLPGEARYRVNMFRQRGEVGAVLRRIPLEVPTVESLGLPPVVNSLADQENGMILVTGPTGSGKTTTLAAMIQHINCTRPVHIMTIEDPIEFVYDDQMAAINQRELNIDTNSLEAALKSVLRQDPDIILMGEMRDRQTISFGITAAETGHLVFATLHTNNAMQTLERILDLTPPEVRDAVRVQLSMILRGIICQRLCARITGGRIAAPEIRVVNETIRQLIDENKRWGVEK